ncbi:hypothetical protein B0H16DRAFT_1479154 [Mycena metata]|uniref:Uncharacterized protein n=1 Tax=Mycena metata TaxID=1033252 RepID=A0AAD7H5B3_9AGAR|nr:hypothetical protein B0H16DRAFT_1479154 [Mycena metata]
MSVLLFPFEQLLHGPSHTTTAENTYLRAPNFCVARCNLPQFVLVADTTGMKEEFTPAVFRYLSELLSRFKIGAAGYIILVASRNAALSYFAVYMAACVWVSNNVEGSYKHSVSLAMTVDAKQSHRANGAVSSNVYCAQDKPWYPLGHGWVFMYILFAFRICRPILGGKREIHLKESVSLEDVDWHDNLYGCRHDPSIPPDPPSFGCKYAKNRKT